MLFGLNCLWSKLYFAIFKLLHICRYRHISIYVFYILLWCCSALMLSSLLLAPIVSCPGSLLCVSHIDLDVSLCCCHVFCFSVSVQGRTPSLIWLPVCVWPLLLWVSRLSGRSLSHFCLLSFPFAQISLCFVWAASGNSCSPSCSSQDMSAALKRAQKKLPHKNGPIIPFSSFNARNLCLGTARSCSDWLAGQTATITHVVKLCPQKSPQACKGNLFTNI